MANRLGAGSIEEAVLDTVELDSEDHDASYLLPFLCDYFVSDEDMKKLEEGVDVRGMQKLLTFLSDGLKKRSQFPRGPRPVLELVFEDDDLTQPMSMEVEMSRDVVTPLELDWDDFYRPRRPKSGVTYIIQDMHGAVDEAVTPAVNLDVHGEAVTPNVHLEVAEKFTLKQRLLYMDLPEETFLLLSLGTDMDALLHAVEDYQADHPDVSHEMLVGLCVNLYRGYGVRFYYQLVHHAMPFGDELDQLVRKHVGQTQAMLSQGTFTREALESHLSALLLVIEKMRQTNSGGDAVYHRFLRGDALQKIA